MMLVDSDSGGPTPDFQYIAKYIKQGFTKLAAKNDNEILYQSSREYASTPDKDWTPELVTKALVYLSKHILNPRHTAKILFIFEQCILKIVRYALASDADHKTKCYALGIVIKNRPHILQHCLSYFNDKGAPWEEEDSDVRSPKKLKLENSETSDLEIVECCWVLLRTNLNYFRDKWNWSDFIYKYSKNINQSLRWMVNQCVALLLGMNESDKLQLLQSHISMELHYDIAVQYEVDNQTSQAMAVDTLAYFDTNPSRVFIPLYKQSVTNLTVNVAGVTLDVKNLEHQSMEGCLVETKSTLSNLRRIAVALQTGRAICLVGPVGSGKTSLISHLALLTGRSLSTDLLKVQLGEEVDSKLLLGSYQCTDIPGEFVWVPGMLTKAVLEGRWLLLEDISNATSDVAALLTNLLEENCITIPGFKDSVRPAPGFHLFMTHRVVSSFSVQQRKDTFSTELLERHWFRINLEPLPRDELVLIIQTKYPVLKTIADKMISVYLLFSQGNHEDEDSSLIHAGSRLISTRDLFKWCRRSIIDFDVSSVDSALKVLQDAIDIFCCSYSSDEKRLELAGEIAACLGFIKMKAEYFCTLYKPAVNITPTHCIAGRGVLPRIDFSNVSSLKSLIEGLKFALTRGSSCLLERVAVCLSLDEPALLVGETGTGKTTTLQLLAKQTGHKLVVINMNQQSDSSDLLGGYKSIDTKKVIMPLRDEFEELFRALFNVEKNMKFLENLSVCISKKKWLMLLKLMTVSQKAAVKNLTTNKPDEGMLTRWIKLGEKLQKLQTQLQKNEAAMAFSFVEGSLIKAMRGGHWVLLDEINLASAETLQCLSGLLEGSTIHLLERGDDKSIEKHPDFRIMAAMNPATDFGKKDLPPGIRNRFTEIFVSEHTEKGDLALVVNCYLPDQPSTKVDAIVDFYLNVRKAAAEVLSDGSGNRPHYSLRTLCRALVIASENRCGVMARSLYEGFCLSFLAQLNSTSHQIVRNMVAKIVGDRATIKSILSQPIPEPVGKQKYIPFEGYWVSKGDYTPRACKKYILTESVRRNLCDLARIVSLSNHPVLIQGGTSVGKTSLIIYQAEASGHRVLRINNHQHTDLQEYVGSYCAEADSGRLVFKEGVLAQAMRRGDWIILDELNLAPSEVLEALNRVLDDNRELFIPETSVTIKAHPDFRIFATQNPPGTYGGRKMLSRAFRNRFVELHFGDIPNGELQEILHQRCQMPRSYCKKLVDVMADLQRHRRGSATFAGKEGYITLRDLFRWGERYRLASSVDHLSYYDWDQHVADEGYLVLAGRVRKKEEQDIIQSVIEKIFKRKIDLDKLFTLNENTSLVTRHILEKIVLPPLPTEFKHLVWTLNLRKLAVLVGKALEFKEPILLVGETGCGKTTICQLLAAIKGQLLYSVNCHQHSESSDFLGGLRPVRQMAENRGKLFEWVDGPLIKAMKEGHMFLVDEISLADDSVLERLNSLLEPERKLLVSEKGSGDDIEIVAREEFHFIGTMNPGGDFGKKELSPALRNRLTEIWCEGPSSDEDLISIIEHNIQPGISFGSRGEGGSGLGKNLVEFISWFSNTDFGKRISVSVRNLLVWVNFINVTVSSGRLDIESAYVHGGCLTLIDGIGSANTSTDNISSIKIFKQRCLEFLLKQLKSSFQIHANTTHLDFLLNIGEICTNLVDEVDLFGIQPFFINKVSPGKAEDFMFTAPTTCLNVLRLLRALQVASRAVLLEGSPGVGKTSLVLALAQATGNKVTRINLSEQTDISDLFGTDLPVEGAFGGTFDWSDGPFLRALKEGHWILLDELNLASQSVIEGLNSVLDHRGEIYIPDLGRTFKVNPEKTKLFACQNPQRQGGSRKGLPQSFLNRFTQVFVEPLSEKDLEVIVNGLYPDTEPEILKRMVDFHNAICLEKWSSPGFWEFNLRDVIRWGESLKEGPPGIAVETIYASRMSSTKDKQKILETYQKVFGSSYPLANSRSPILVTPTTLIIGEITLSRMETNGCYDSFSGKDPLLVLRDQHPALKSLSLCVKMGWMSILIGKSGSGKTSLVHTLAHLLGKKLNTVPVSSAMDTTDLLGGFEQTDLWRHLEGVARDVERLVLSRAGQLMLARSPGNAADLLARWHAYTRAVSALTYELKASKEKFRAASSRLSGVLEALPGSADKDRLSAKLLELDTLLSTLGLQAGGVFEWVDSLLIKCVREGEWLLLENVNLCSGAVLDRLNSLLERGGSLSLGERGTSGDHIRPHPDFRIFLTMDPRHGSISRAMRNRGVEIYLDVPSMETVHPFDLDTMLYNCGVHFETHRKSLREIHKEIIDKNIGPEQPGLHHLLEVAYIACQNWKQGFSMFDSVEKASLDIYVKSRTLSSEQRKSLKNALNDILKGHKNALLKSEYSSVDCFWPQFKTPSTLDVQRDSHSAIAKQHFAIIYAILKNIERANSVHNWPKEFTLNNILGGELSLYQNYYGTKYINLNYDVLAIIPYLITSYYCCATSNDILIRRNWLIKTVNHIQTNSYSDSSSSVFDVISHISSNIYAVFKKFLPSRILKDRPWDERHITNINNSPFNNALFSNENKIFTYICFRIICAVYHAEEEKQIVETKWKLMSAVEYSMAVKKGNIDNWPYRDPLVLELFPLLSAFDDVLISALNSAEVTLPNSSCADLIYKLAWRFKLSTAGRRRLFKVGRTSGAPPSVCQETISMIKLHYSWFKKHTVSSIMELTKNCADLQGKIHGFYEILMKIDSSLDDGSIHMMPIARKFRKLSPLPSPKSSTMQCNVSKKVQSIESDIDIWRSSANLVSKINFLASDKGDEIRSKIISAGIQLLENKELDLLDDQISEMDSFLKGILENCTPGLKEMMRIKTWPLFELICVKLSAAGRKSLSSPARAPVDTLLLDSLTSWLRSTPSVSPATAAGVQVLISQKAASSVELSYYLTDYPNTSPSHSFPLALINWEETSTTHNEGYTLLDDKSFYMSHMPLASLFLSKILTGFSSQQDMPSFALKAHSNMSKMFHAIKLLLWRNLPALYSSELCNRSNEISCIKNIYSTLLLSLKKAFNSKNKDCILASEISEIALEISSILDKMNGTKQSALGELEKSKPEKALSQSLLALQRLLPELDGSGEWLVIGEAWAHIGRLNLLLFSLLEPVDPVKKQALKKQYVSEEISELHTLLCVEELHKLLIGAPPTWPLKVEHEARIALLESKYSVSDKETAIRPTLSLYSEILKDIVHLTSVLVSNKIFSSRLSSLINLYSSNQTKEEADLVFAETWSWLTSLVGISQKLYSKYYVEYPDIVSPVLMAMSQINYGLKLVWTSAQKKTLQKPYRGRVSIQSHLKTLSIFPVCGLKSALELLECCSSNEIVKLLNKSLQDSSHHQEQQYKIKLIKICIRTIKSFSQTYIMKYGTNTFFQVLDHVVSCWHQIQEQEKIKKAQEDSIYINRMKLTEEELLEREKRELFPSSREQDFYDIEAPETLEGLGQVPEEPQKSDPLKLSLEEIAEVCLLHGEIVREASAPLQHWLPRAGPAEHHLLELLRERVEVFSALLSGHFRAADGEELDFASLPALLLATSASRAQVDPKPQLHYNFYKDPNISESRTCIPLLNAILKRVKELLDEWPDHPTLNQIILIIERVLGFSMGSPLSRFLTGLELLLTKLHNWEENAHSGVSLAQHQAALTQQIIQWRRLELSAWKGALSSASQRIESNCRKYWFHLYSLITSFVRGSVEEIEKDIEDLVKSLEGFMESSTLGDFAVRLELLYTFHCHALLLPASQRRGTVVSILWNLYSFYKLFSSSVLKVIEDLTKDVKDKVKKFVQIARWNDINYYAVKAAIDKTHHTLLKHIKEYEKILNEPASGAMTKMEVFKNVSKTNLCNLKVSNFLTSSILPESYRDKETESSECLFHRLNLLLKRSRSLSSKIIRNCNYSKMLDNFELLIEDVEETGKLINELDIDPAIPKEKKKSGFKALLQRKRKALSDLFKTLSQIGLSYRSGVIMFEQKNIDFAKIEPLDIRVTLNLIENRKSDKDWLACWKGAEYYFYTTIAKLASLKIALEKPHRDLGPQFIERIKGFSSHSNNLLQHLKETLGKTTLTLYLIRSQIIQLKKISENDFGIIDSNFYSNKNNLQEVLEDIIYCLKQFIILLDACPEQEVALNENQPVPMIFPDVNKQSMVTALKNDTLWESTKAKLESLINFASAKLNQLHATEKHRSFSETISSSHDKNVDIIICDKSFKVVEGGYDDLRKIFADISELEKYFEQNIGAKVLTNPVTSSLGDIKSKINKTLDAHKPIVYYSSEQHFNDFSHMLSFVPNGLKDKLESFLNKALCIVQNVYKSHVVEVKSSTEAPESKLDEPESEGKTEESEARVEQAEGTELIVDGHLKEKIVEHLMSDVNILRIPELSEELGKILADISSLDNTIEKEACQGLLYHIHPLLDQLVSIYNYFIIQLTAAMKILGKFTAYFISVFIDFSKNGYRIPEEMLEGEEEGESQQKGGLGLGEGEGEKDVSDQIESEDQLEDARRPGDYGKDEEKDCKEEEKGIEMSENFDSKLQDLEKKDDEEQKSDAESDNEEELDKEMGETEKGADTLDKQIWGSDSEEELEDEEQPKDEKGNKGEQQTEKELGAGEDEDKEEVGEKEEGKRKQPKEKEINEMEDQEVDDDQIDPYHGKQQPSPEVEPLELEDEDMALDDDDEEKKSEGDEEENPFDIDTMKKNIDDKPSEESEPMEEDKPEEKGPEEGEESDEGETAPEVRGPEKEEEEEEAEEGSKDEEGKETEKEEEMEEKAGHDESEGADEQPTQQEAEKSERMEGSRDQVKNKEESSMESELNPEESKAEGREEAGTGKAEKMDIESGGHRGEAGKRKQRGEREQEERRQRPGQSEIERSLGETNEPVKKRLKTIGVEKEGGKEEEAPEERVEEDADADLYQHIHEAKESQHDAQTLDAATQEQAEKQPNIGKEDEDKEELMEDEEINVVDEDDIKVDVDAAPQQESSHLEEAETRPEPPTKNKGEGGGPLEEAKVQVEGEFVETATVSRGTESSYHTRLSEAVPEPMTEAELLSLRQQLQDQLATWRQPPETGEAHAAWEKVCSLTSSLAQQLSEELRLVLEPTTASSLRGDFRTGKRINMRKVIPYIASQFRKDKIWLRRTKPSKREYQIIVAIDDSSSMADNHSKELAFESLAVVSKALNLIEAGELAVVSFGEKVRVLHQLGDPFTESTGARLLQEFSFDEKRTRVGAAVETALGLISQRGPDSAQLLVIISDGRCVMSEGEQTVRAAVRKASHSRLFIVFIIIDSPNSKDSVLDIRLATFTPEKKLEMKSYIDSFPFPFYLILRDISNLPSVLSDALRQWFELVTDIQ